MSTQQEQELKLEKQIRDFVNGSTPIYFLGCGQFCKFIIDWFKSKNIDLPTAVFDKNKEFHGKVINGVTIADLNQVYNNNSNLKIIITDLENSDTLYTKLIGYLGENQVLKISQYFKQTPPPQNNQPKLSPAQAEFAAKNKRYTDSLRGLNNDKFDLLKPEDMPEHAKQMVKKLEYLKQSYLAGENFYIDKEKTMLLQDFCSRGYMNGVRRIAGYQEHLVGIEINLTSTFKTDIDNSIENVTQLSNYLNSKDIPFMYMQLPCKLSPKYDTLPEGTVNISNINATKFVQGLQENQVNIFDYREFMLENNIDFLDSFFKTDHHWKPITAYDATIQLCKKIEKLIDINIDWDKLDINNYDRIIYPKILLGSHGKSTGILYSGVDDFELILPKYETEYTWSCPERGLKKHGKADKALVYPLHLDWNYNLLNPYAVYSLMDDGYSIIQNHKISSNSKILCLHDSYSNPVSIFLSPQFKETHFLDLRRTRKNLFGIIDIIKPDIVVMLYTTFSFNNNPIMTDVNPNNHIK